MGVDSSVPEFAWKHACIVKVYILVPRFYYRRIQTIFIEDRV